MCLFLRGFVVILAFVSVIVSDIVSGFAFVFEFVFVSVSMFCRCFSLSGWVCFAYLCACL